MLIVVLQNGEEMRVPEVRFLDGSLYIGNGQSLKYYNVKEIKADKM